MSNIIKHIPLDKVTIDRLEELFNDSLKMTFNGEQCILRFNPHHTGYAYTTVGGIKYPVHRIVKAVAAGNNNPELVVDHLCRNRSCIRPAHLEFVTVSENIRRGTAWLHWLGQTECKQGHSLDNAHIRKNGTKVCRPCHARRERSRRKLLKEASHA